MDPEKPCNQITELVRILRALFRLEEFDEVHEILVNREKTLTFELESLRKERDLIKKNCDLAESISRQAELDKSVYLDGLQRSQRECEGLKAEEKRLRKNERMLREKLGRANERCDVDRDSYMKIINGQKEVISKLNAEISELEDGILRLQGEKQAAEETVEQLKLKNLEVIEELNNRKLGFDNSIAEMKVVQSVAEETIRELRSRNEEAFKSVNELRSEKLNSNEYVEKLRCERDQVLATLGELEKRVKRFEFESMAADNAMAEMKEKLSRANQDVDQLRRIKRAASLTERELRNRISKHEETIKEMARLQSIDEKTVQELRTQLKQASRTVGKFRTKLSNAEHIIQHLRSQNLEFSHTSEELRQRLLRSDAIFENMRLEQEEAIEDLKQRLLRSDAIIKKMRLEQEETIEELKERLLRSDAIIEKMRLEKEEAEKTMKDLKCSCCEASRRARQLSRQKRSEKLFPIRMEMEEINEALKFTLDKIVDLRSEVGKPSLGDFAIVDEASSDANMLKTGIKNMNSTCSVKEKDANDMNARTSSQASKHYGYTPQADREGKRQKKIILLPDSENESS